MKPAGDDAVLPVLRDWLTMLGVLAVVCVAARVEVSLKVCVLALLPCLALGVARRKLVHRYLLAIRRRAQALRRVLIVGEAGAVDVVLAELAHRTDHEYVVVGSCLVGEETTDSAVPVPARLASDGNTPEAALDGETVLGCAAELDADLVFVAPGRQLSAARVRRLAWALHDGGRNLAILPGLIDVSQHRVRLAKAAGLTVMHIDPAARRGMPVLLKQITDRLGALLLLMLLSPVFALVAAAIRLTSSGPVFYWQIRVGQDLMPFRMWKFRTMVVTADRMRAALESANEHDGAMFKIRRDPRVTPVGRVLRRFSLDELPQLFNVLVGHMSLVGPRPPLPEEVERYNGTELRQADRQTGSDRSVAGQRAVRSHLGRDRRPGSELCGQLVLHPRHRCAGPNRACRRGRARCVLAGSGVRPAPRREAGAGRTARVGVPHTVVSSSRHAW